MMLAYIHVLSDLASVARIVHARVCFRSRPIGLEFIRIGLSVSTSIFYFYFRQAYFTSS